jgi:hypothetical protein
MQSMITDLTDAGWIRVGPYSPYWKAPDDTGPVGRKWSEQAAHAEMIARRSVKVKTPAKPKTAAAKRGPGRPRKTPAPVAESDG